jgi:hypothetical protein
MIPDAKHPRFGRMMQAYNSAHPHVTRAWGRVYSLRAIESETCRGPLPSSPIRGSGRAF